MLSVYVINVPTRLPSLQQHKTRPVETALYCVACNFAFLLKFSLLSSTYCF